MSDASDFDTAEGLYDEIDGLRAMLAIREQQMGEIMAAGRAVTARGGHTDGCLIRDYGGCTCGWENALADLATLLAGYS